MNDGNFVAASMLWISLEITGHKRERKCNQTFFYNFYQSAYLIIFEGEALDNEGHTFVGIGDLDGVYLSFSCSWYVWISRSAVTGRPGWRKYRFWDAFLSLFGQWWRWTFLDDRFSRLFASTIRGKAVFGALSNITPGDMMITQFYIKLTTRWYFFVINS